MIDEAAGDGEKPGSTPLQTVAGAVTFDNVTFRYDGGPQGVSDVSFKAKAGETIAIVGPTGSGKSTMIALLQRFLTPERRARSPSTAATSRT